MTSVKGSAEMRLVWPSPEYLPSYVAALQQRWSPDNLRPQAAPDERNAVAANACVFIAEQGDHGGNGGRVVLPDATAGGGLPGYRKWRWHREFCGAIGV